eukprot:scaffold113004_cov32-Tisochrysis_lutea.AAC.4
MGWAGDRLRSEHGKKCRETPFCMHCLNQFASQGDCLGNKWCVWTQIGHKKWESRRPQSFHPIQIMSSMSL